MRNREIETGVSLEYAASEVNLFQKSVYLAKLDQSSEKWETLYAKFFPYEYDEYIDRKSESRQPVRKNFWYHNFKHTYNHKFSRIFPEYIRFIEAIVLGKIDKVEEIIAASANTGISGLFSYVSDSFNTQKNLVNGIPPDNEFYELPPLAYTILNNQLAIAAVLLEHGAEVNKSDENKVSMLHLAVRYNRRKFVKLLLDRGAKVSAVDYEADTPLHYAAYYADLVLLFDLIENSAVDFNALNCRNETPLMLAAKHRSAKFAEKLIISGAFIDSQNEKGETALHYAAKSANTPVVDLLIKNGARISNISAQRETALFAAIRNKDYDTFRLLLNHMSKTEINFLNKQNISALMLATLFAQTWMVSDLSAAGAINTELEPNRELLTSLRQELEQGSPSCLHPALLTAINSSQLSMTKIILELGADCDQLDPEEKTALHYAVENKNAAIAEALIAKGASLNITNNISETALFSAVRNGSLELVSLLAQHMSANFINIANRQNITALLIAVELDRTEVVRILLRYGADPKVTNPQGLLAIHIALIAGNFELVKLLLKSGDDFNAKFPSGESLLHMAIKHGHARCAEYILANDGSIEPEYLSIQPEASNTTLILELILKYNQVEAFNHLFATAFDTVENNSLPLMHLAIKLNSPQAVLSLIRLGFNLEEYNCKGDTPLTFAVIQNNENIVQILLTSGADVNKPAKDGSTALYLAIYLRRSILIGMLLHFGANINQELEDYSSLLIYAIERFGQKSAITAEELEIIEIIMSNKADINKTDQNGITPLICAIKKEYIGIAIRLIKAGADISATTAYGLTPLHFAEKITAGIGGREELIRMLGGSVVECESDGVESIKSGIYPNILA